MEPVLYKEAQHFFIDKKVSSSDFKLIKDSSCPAKEVKATSSMVAEDLTATYSLFFVSWLNALLTSAVMSEGNSASSIKSLKCSAISLTKSVFLKSIFSRIFLI